MAAQASIAVGQGYSCLHHGIAAVIVIDRARRLRQVFRRGDGPKGAVAVPGPDTTGAYGSLRDAALGSALRPVSLSALPQRNIELDEAGATISENAR